MPCTPSRLQDHHCQILSNETHGEGLKILRLKTQEPFCCEPGQFVMLDLPGGEFRFRRPFSVLDYDLEKGTLDIYYKVVGTGTRMMSLFEPGMTLRCLGPLGQGFTPPKFPETALYIGGGIGIAPLYCLAKHGAKDAESTGHCFYGVRSQAEVGLGKELAAVFSDRLHISTDDGSSGRQGTVCDLLKDYPELVQDAQEVYICGPTKMMAAASDLLLRFNPSLRVQVSLEEHMPCGTGACTGCVVPRTDQYLPSKVCLEGPVFEARSIQWDGAQLPLAQFFKESSCPL